MNSLQWSKSKSNRDVLCLKCWKIMKYEESVKHKMLEQDHIKSILTSKEFASETKFVSVARAMGKVKLIGETEFFENPFKPREKKRKFTEAKE